MSRLLINCNPKYIASQLRKLINSTYEELKH